MKLHLLEEISRLKAQASVEFIDQVPQDKLVDYYQQSAVCVVPSLWENHPYAVLEAMACGKAVIASGVGGIPEIIKDKYSGILVLPGSFISLAEAIIGVLGDNGLQRMLGDNARKYIEDKYASSAVVQENLKVYKELLA
jgi:glycosyltransferase involved in cell wall biosynthesis